MVMVYYSESIQINISKGKMHIGQSPGDTRYELPVVLSQWNCTGMHLILPSVMWDNTYEVLPTRVVHPSLGVQDFYWWVGWGGVSLVSTKCMHNPH